MFSFLIAAAALAFAPAAPSATAKAPAVLREIVYRFNYDRKVEKSVEEFGAPNLNVGGTNALSGKLTVDVTQVDGAGAVRVTATTAYNDAVNVKKPFVADIVIRPDGNIVLLNGETDDIMITLIPYFATNYFGDRQLQEGATWKAVATAADKTQTSTTYSVSNVTTDTATISSESSAKGGDTNGTLSIETKLVYKAALLVPISLDIVVIRFGNGQTGGQTSTQDAQTHYHFDRISDTRDTAGKGQ